MSEAATAPRNRVAGGTQPTPTAEVTATRTEVTATKTPRTRTPSEAKPAFIIMQILDESGQPTHFDKKRVKVLAVERDPAKVLAAIDAGEYNDAFYLRVVVPAGSRAGIPNKPKA